MRVPMLIETLSFTGATFCCFRMLVILVRCSVESLAAPAAEPCPVVLLLVVAADGVVALLASVVLLASVALLVSEAAGAADAFGALFSTASLSLAALSVAIVL